MSTIDTNLHPQPTGAAAALAAAHSNPHPLKLYGGWFCPFVQRAWIVLAEKKIQGSNMGSNRFRVDMPRYVDMYLQGRLNLDDMISTRIPLDEVNDAFARMRNGEITRDVILFD